MAHLFKPQKVYYVDAEGKRVPAGTPGARKVKEKLRKWYAKGPPLPRGKKVPLAADKQAAQQMLASLLRQAERGTADVLADLVQVIRARPELADLVKVIAAWPDLAAPTRAAILALVGGSP
jgi:hypothetical protein